MSKRKIVAVTGARSEYDLLFSVYERLNADSRFDFSIIVTGPHLSERFGFTIKNIKADGFTIADQIINLVDSDQKYGRVISLGYQIPGLAQTLHRLNPDIVLVAGDREEALSTSITCAFMDIPVAHFFGGDVAKDGNIDNSVRYAVSKFAHLHFPSLEIHKQNLLRLGEDDWRIHVVGNPALDRLINTEKLDLSELSERLNIDSIPKNYFVLIQHSIITEVDKQAEQIEKTLAAIRESGIFCFVNYPNSDPGNTAIIEAYSRYAKKYENQFFLFKNLDRVSYVNLLRNATALIGNSSSGLLEAPSLGLPAINIGARQRGRVHGQNVVFVNNDTNEIREAISKVLNDKDFRNLAALRENPYGNGRSSEKVVDVLASVELNDLLIHKNITY